MIIAFSGTFVMEVSCSLNLFVCGLLRHPNKTCFSIMRKFVFCLTRSFDLKCIIRMGWIQTWRRWLWRCCLTLTSVLFYHFIQFLLNAIYTWLLQQARAYYTSFMCSTWSLRKYSFTANNFSHGFTECLTQGIWVQWTIIPG